MSKARPDKKQAKGEHDKGSMRPRSLSPKQRLFVGEYLVDFNATKAALKAGYSGKTAQEQSSRLLSNVMVQEAIRTAIQEREKRIAITTDKVLAQYARLAFHDIRKAFNPDGTLKPIHEIDDDTAAAISGIETAEINGPEGMPLGVVRKIKLANKRDSLQDIGKHLGMFREIVDNISSDGSMTPKTAIDLSRLTPEQLAELGRSAFTQEKD